MLGVKKEKPLAEKWIALEKAIYTHPIELASEDIVANGNPKNESIFDRADDRKIVLNLGAVSWYEVFGALFAVFMSFYIVIPSIYSYNMIIDVNREMAEMGHSSYSESTQKKYYREELVRYYERNGLSALRKIAQKKTDIIIALIIGTPLCLSMLYWLYTATKRSRDRLVFDRLEATVSYRYNYGLSRCKYPFDETIFQSLMASFLRPDSNYLAMRFPGRRSFASVSDLLPYISVSLYVWFMDRNRPLPPGTAFDSYRETDYIRRRAEGFPTPLYPSGILTPEADYLVEKYKDTDAAKRAKLLYNSSLKGLAYREDALRNS